MTRPDIIEGYCDGLSRDASHLAERLDEWGWEGYCPTDILAAIACLSEIQRQWEAMKREAA